MSTFEILGGATPALALLVALEAWRTRPPTARARSRFAFGTAS